MTDDTARIAALTAQNAALRKALVAFKDGVRLKDTHLRTAYTQALDALALPAPSPSRVAALVEAAIEETKAEDALDRSPDAPLHLVVTADIARDRRRAAARACTGEPGGG